MVSRLTNLADPCDEAGALSSLTRAVYDAVVDPGLWTAAMEAASSFVVSHSSVVLSWSAASAGRFVHDDGRLDPAFKSLYEQRYSRLDRVSGANRVAGLDEAYSIADVVDMEPYRNTEFYRDFAAPQDLVDRLVVPVARNGRETLLFGVLRSERDGPVTEMVRRRAQLLVPHIRQAMRIGGLMQSARAQAGSFSDVIEAMTAAVFLLDGRGRIVHANEAAEAAIAERRAVLSRDGRLVTVDSAASSALAAAIANADTTGGRSIVIPSRDGTRFAGHVVPLNSPSLPGDARVAVFVQPAGSPGAPEIVAQAFELSQAERRVLAGVAEGGSIAEVAARIGISAATVKTHLQRIFAKTGTSRQSDLVRLVAGFTGPFRR